MRLAMIGLGKMGGNSNDHDSLSRGAWLAERGIGVMDGGTSGGVWGLENGYCLLSVMRNAFGGHSMKKAA